MTSKALRALPDGSYVLARVSNDPETVRLRGVREPTERELRHGHSSNRVEIRRFLTGGWLDTWVLPRDVIAATDPPDGILRQIEYVETVVGQKPER
jgi:hypothetical protein